MNGATNGAASELLLRDHLVKLEGARAAAWLLGRRPVRWQLHQTGHYVIHFPGEKSAAPAWVRYALAHLQRQRQGTWEVTETKRADGAAQWIIFWKGWRTNGTGNERKRRNERKRSRRSRS